MMLVSDFDYKLPSHLIAQTPLLERDTSRMMVLCRESGDIIHSRFEEFPNYLNKGDVLILNDTKVIPARLWGKKEERDIEFLFLRELKKNVWEVLCRPARRVKLDDLISFQPGFEGRVIKIEPEGRRLLQFSSKDVFSTIKNIGFAPLPPYIKRKIKDTSWRSLDLERYQTVFAQKESAIAAPTAGLHFTPQTLKKIKTKGVKIAHISLDVGLATFQPVRVKHVENHKMLEETYSINPAASRTVNEAKIESRPIVAVGTTSVRTLESAFTEGKVRPGRDSTSLFIYPGYEFKCVDRLLTNFHLPQSTLLMMVAAFAGLNLIKKAYREAVRQKYRFYSYGDCMFII